MHDCGLVVWLYTGIYLQHQLARCDFTVLAGVMGAQSMLIVTFLGGFRLQVGKVQRIDHY